MDFVRCADESLQVCVEGYRTDHYLEPLAGGWKFRSIDEFGGDILSADELREIASKLDELNAIQTHSSP